MENEHDEVFKCLNDTNMGQNRQVERDEGGRTGKSGDRNDGKDRGTRGEAPRGELRRRCRFCFQGEQSRGSSLVERCEEISMALRKQLGGSSIRGDRFAPSPAL